MTDFPQHILLQFWLNIQPNVEISTSLSSYNFYLASLFIELQICQKKLFSIDDFFLTIFEIQKLTI